MTNFYPGLARGPIDHNASSVINAISNEAIEMGSAVTWVTSISASELLPRVGETTINQEKSYGIAVGGDNDGIYSTTGAPSNTDKTRATVRAGQGVVVVTQGRCLARVNGIINSGMVPGDPLTPTDSVKGALIKSTGLNDLIVARALQSSTAINDIIAVDVQREGILP